MKNLKRAKFYLKRMVKTEDPDLRAELFRIALALAIESNDPQTELFNQKEI